MFAGTAADRVGISFRSVSPGVAAYPVTTAGGGPQQRGPVGGSRVKVNLHRGRHRDQARTSCCSRHLFSIEDNARLPGLADAIQRDMSAAMAETVDRVCFNGDNGANENSADITGLRTAGVTEATLTQANKVKGDELVKFFLGLRRRPVRRQPLRTFGSCASVGSNQLWGGRVHAATVENQTVASSSCAPTALTGPYEVASTPTRPTATLAPTWALAGGSTERASRLYGRAAELTRDPYSGADKGEVQLTLNYLWSAGVPSDFQLCKRLKYVSLGGRVVEIGPG